MTKSTMGRPYRAALQLVAVLLVSAGALAADFDTPVAITGVTAVTQPGEAIENATILLDGDRIVAVGASVSVPAHAEVVDGSGLWAYAGFIDGASHVGIKAKGPSDEEKERLKDQEQKVDQGPRTGMQRANRQGVWPHLTVFDLYEADDKTLKEYRAAGFTTALVSPHPDIIGGQGDVVQLGGHAIRRSVVAPSVTQIFGMGAPGDRNAFGARGYPGSPMGVFALIRQTFMDAQWYRDRHALYTEHANGLERVVFDPVLDAMGGLLDREQQWIFLANTANEIHHALDLANEFDQRIAILGGKDAWKLASRLAEENVPVIASLEWDDKPLLAPKAKKEKEIKTYTTVTWTPEWEKDYYEPLAVRNERIREWEEQVNNVHVLMAAGVRVALTDRDLRARRKLLPSRAQKDRFKLFAKAREALELELTEEELLTALTTAPAALFGLEEQLGSIAPGMLANLTLMTKPLEDEESQVRKLFIDGERFDFDVSEKVESEEGEEDGEDSEDAEEEDKDPEDIHPWDSESAKDRERTIFTNGDVLLKNATVVTVSQGTLENADILVVNGRIQAMGRGLQPRNGTTVLDVAGYWVMPGIIDPHSHLAVTGINEFTQSISAEVRQSDVVNHTQLGIHRALAGGVTTIHTMHGSANSIGGQNAVLKLRYNTSPADMLLTSGPRIVKFALGENVTRARTRPRYPNSRMGVESVHRQAFNAALEYRKEWATYRAQNAAGDIAELPRKDLRLEALSDIVAGDIWVHSHCYRGDEMLRLLQVAQDYGFRIGTLQHVLEGYRVAPEMYNHGVGGSTFADWWSYKKEAFDAIPYNAAMMMRQGIVTSLNSDSAEVIRHLNLEAAKTMRFGGLSADEALRLITINPAIQIGLEERVGSIEIGKDGDFAIFNGHPLDAFARNVMTIIEGEVFFAHPGHEFDGTQAGPARGFVPTAPRELMHLESLPPAERYAVVGATVHPVSGSAIENGVVVIANGKIEAIGKDIRPPRDAQVVDASGLHVYPGLINASTKLGLVEISGIQQTVDSRELALFQPDLRTLSAVNPHSEHHGVTLCEGITLAHVTSSGGIISGRGSVIQLAGWTLPEMLREGETGLVVDLPSLPLRLKEEERRKILEEHQEVLEKIEAYLRKAQHYAKVTSMGNVSVVKDIRLEAMRPYVNGEKRVFFRADTYKEILEALQFADTFGLKPVILGGADAWKCAERLAENDTPVIVTDVFRVPTSRFERFDAYYTNAARLEEAGVLFCIASDGAEFARQMPVRAGFAVAHGLSEEGGLRAITLDAARILGVEDAVGSLEKGKVADVIITTGNPLQASTRTVGMFIAGKPVELTSLHERSYERFSNRPQPDLEATGELRGPPPMRVAPGARKDTD